MAATPAWVDDLLRSSETTYRPAAVPGIAERGGAGGDDVEGYIRTAASRRGIDPDTAVRVAQSEGGLVPNRTGSFATGKSFWPFQLHYGGKGYEQFGTVAGMGNTFTAQTGYQPGDPSAWRAATDYALDRAKEQGWGPWYGARNVGVTGYQGINRGAASAAPGGNPAAAPSGRGMVGEDAPPWVSDLVDRGPREPDPVGRGIETMRAGETRDPAAPPWVRELLATGSVGAAGGAADYRGAPQTDEIWPVAGQRRGAVNNPFGAGQSRAAGTTVELPSQNVGADLTARYGDAVVAPVSGTVVEVFDAPDERDRNANHGWGGMTLLRGDNGYFYRLSHAQPGSIATRPGQRVQQGQVLQRVGTSGNTTGPHLDAEKFARPGEYVDIAGGSGTVGRGAARGGPSGGPVPAWVRELMGS